MCIRDSPYARPAVAARGWAQVAPSFLLYERTDALPAEPRCGFCHHFTAHAKRAVLDKRKSEQAALSERLKVAKVRAVLESHATQACVCQPCV
eukprot:3593590-Prymnesium_polylepis.1